MFLRRAGIGLVAISVILGLGAAGAAADRDQEKEARILEALSRIDPGLVPIFTEATVALDQGRFDDAAAKYQQVLERAPSFSPALRRCGSALLETGRTAEGLSLLERAVSTERTAENLWSLAAGLARRSGTTTVPPEEIRRAMGLLEEARRIDRADPDILIFLGSLALDLGEGAVFHDVVSALRRAHPDRMETHYFAAIAAAMSGDRAGAEREIERARETGLPEEAVNEFRAGALRPRTARWGIVGAFLAVATLWAAGLVLLFVSGKLLSAATLRSIERDDPNERTGGSVRAVRRVYRVLVNIAGVYYYISLPIVAALVVGATGSILYAFWQAGRVPIKLALVLVVGAIMTVIAILRSLFVRVRDRDPGRGLPSDGAPALWGVVKEVAQAVGTRPVNEIWLTPGTELAVCERGRLLDRIRDRGRRALILGVGVFEGFRLNAFRAVLAHEYGHFSQRDTAGGDVALRVNRSMLRFAHALAEAGFAVWWNLGFHFLRIYHYLFRRLTHGATRLQEVLADRVAVQAYGAAAFEEGLTHAIRRGVEFDRVVSRTVQEAVERDAALANLYVRGVPCTDDEAREVEEEVSAIIRRPTSEEDTHPSPSERFRLAERIAGSPAPATDETVWSLFPDRDALTEAMTAAVASLVKLSNPTWRDA